MAVGKLAPGGSREEARERLAVEAAQKDPSRFIDLYEENFERVYGFIARRVRERDTAEDLTSEVFHKALAHLPNFDYRGVPFAAWLLRIAANLVHDRWRARAREVIEDPPDVGGQVNRDEIEEGARLFRLAGKLPADQHRVIVLRFAEDKSIREIAQELGRSDGAVKQLQFRALETLRAQLSGKKRVGKNA
ncbi:MAG TPA: sigma-70 family RNA polymerase sigma factor [Terriglobales bacterium]|jgi:RNA polymerase sigma-70 factor (ECF subfamily)